MKTKLLTAFNQLMHSPRSRSDLLKYSQIPKSLIQNYDLKLELIFSRRQLCVASRGNFSGWHSQTSLSNQAPGNAIDRCPFWSSAFLFPLLLNLYLHGDLVVEQRMHFFQIAQVTMALDLGSQSSLRLWRSPLKLTIAFLGGQ